MSPRCTELSERIRARKQFRKAPRRWMPLKEYASLRGIAYGTLKRWVSQKVDPIPVSRPLFLGGNRVWPPDADEWLLKQLAKTGRGVRGVSINRQSEIYFASLVGSGLVKIGFSSDVARRLTELRKGQRGEMKLLGSFPGNKKDELEVHRHLAVHRQDGEWFVDCAEVRAVIAELCPGDVPAHLEPLRVGGESC